MSTTSKSSNGEPQDPWLPMIVISMGQALMSSIQFDPDSLAQWKTKDVCASGSAPA